MSSAVPDLFAISSFFFSSAALWAELFRIDTPREADATAETRAAATLAGDVIDADEDDAVDGDDDGDAGRLDCSRGRGVAGKGGTRAWLPGRGESRGTFVGGRGGVQGIGIRA